MDQASGGLFNNGTIGPDRQPPAKDFSTRSSRESWTGLRSFDFRALFLFFLPPSISGALVLKILSMPGIRIWSPRKSLILLMDLAMTLNYF
jgi:hypothetical protein